VSGRSVQILTMPSISLGGLFFDASARHLQMRTEGPKSLLDSALVESEGSLERSIQLGCGYLALNARLYIAIGGNVSAQFFEYCFRLRKLP
jgi:hypothetical protein